MKRITCLLITLILVLGVMGCASMQITKDMPAVQKADLVLQDIESGLVIAGEARNIALAAFPDKAAEISSKTETAFKVANTAVGVLRDAVTAWYATGEAIDIQDWSVMTGAARKAVTDVVVLVAELRAEYAAKK